MNEAEALQKLLETYCFGCSGGHVRVRFVRPEGDRYAHMAGSVGRDGRILLTHIVCTATMGICDAIEKGDM